MRGIVDFANVEIHPTACRGGSTGIKYFLFVASFTPETDYLLRGNSKGEFIRALREKEEGCPYRGQGFSCDETVGSIETVCFDLPYEATKLLIENTQKLCQCMPTRISAIKGYKQQWEVEPCTLMRSALLSIGNLTHLSVLFILGQMHRNPDADLVDVVHEAKNAILIVQPNDAYTNGGRLLQESEQLRTEQGLVLLNGEELKLCYDSRTTTLEQTAQAYILETQKRLADELVRRLSTPSTQRATPVPARPPRR